MQLGALNVPAAVPVLVKATVPAGVLAPAPLVSATVAVHVEGWLIATVAGEHVMLVEVVLSRPFTVPLLAPLLELPACTESLAVYVPLIVAVPAALGVNVTEQLPATFNVQLGALKVPARPEAVKATEPAGVDAPAPLVSATVAVQVEGWLIGTEAGLQTTVVDVVLAVTVTVVAPELGA